MTDNRISEVRTTQQEAGQESRVFTFKFTQLVWLLFGILEALIALRIGLKLIGANAASPIAAFIYGITDLFLAPFVGLTATPSAGGMVLELSSVIALLVYALIAWALVKIIDVVFYRPRGGSVVAVERTTTTDHHTPD
ncbi:MAG: YggT family protein [Anaerolineales bacterium]|nr:YggT family protein [Anaerolineales bacterium]